MCDSFTFCLIYSIKTNSHKWNLFEMHFYRLFFSPVSLYLLLSFEIFDMIDTFFFLYFKLSAFSHFIHIRWHLFFRFYLEKIHNLTSWVILLYLIKHIVELSFQLLNVSLVSNHHYLPQKIMK